MCITYQNYLYIHQNPIATGSISRLIWTEYIFDHHLSFITIAVLSFAISTPIIIYRYPTVLIAIFYAMSSTEIFLHNILQIALITNSFHHKIRDKSRTITSSLKMLQN